MKLFKGKKTNKDNATANAEQGAKRISLAARYGAGRLGAIFALFATVLTCLVTFFVTSFGGVADKELSVKDDSSVNASAATLTYTTWAAASNAKAFVSGNVVNINLAANLTATSGDANYGTTFGAKGTKYTSLTDNRGYYYGALLVPTGCTVNLNLKTFTINRGLYSSTARANGSVIIVAGTLNLTGNTGYNTNNGTMSGNQGTITGGNTTGDGGGINVLNGGSLYMKGGRVTKNKAKNGGGIATCGANTWLNRDVSHSDALYKGIVDYNTASNYGGGIFFNGTYGGRYQIYSLNVNNNTAKNGGGVAIWKTPYECYFGDDYLNIYNNTASEFGGGIYIEGNTSVQGNGLQYGRAFKNKAKNGGGLAVAKSAFCWFYRRFYIHNNTATNNGGGVACYGTVYFRRYNNNIPRLCNNTATNFGGGVYSAGDFQILGGWIGLGMTAATNVEARISGFSANNDMTKNAAPNTAKVGGGIYIDSNASGTVGGGSAAKQSRFWAYGGDIRYNTATTTAGGVYYNGEGMWLRSQYNRMYIKENKVGSANSNLYLANNKKFYINDRLWIGGCWVGISTQTAPTDTAGVPVVYKYNSNTLGAVKDYFFSDAGYGFNNPASNSADIQLVKKGGTNMNTSYIYDSWDAARAAKAFVSGRTVRIWNLWETAARTGDTNYGTTFGAKNTVYSSNTDSQGIYRGALLVPKGCTVWLGCGLTYFNRRIDKARPGGCIIDCYGKLIIGGFNAATCHTLLGGNNTESGGGVVVRNGGNCQISGVWLHDCKTNGNGGGVYVENGGVFTFDYGYINNCTAANAGGGVYTNGTFQMWSGELGSIATGQGNVAKNGGGAYIDTKGVMDHRGGYVSNNKATALGAGIFQNGVYKLDEDRLLRVRDNYLSNGKNNNMYLPNGKKITVTGTVTRTDSIIEITTQTVPTGATTSGVLIVDAYTASFGAIVDAKGVRPFVSDAGTAYGFYQSAAGAAVYHCKGGDYADDPSNLTFKSWAEASAAKAFQPGNTVNITMQANMNAVADANYGMTLGTPGTLYTSGGDNRGYHWGGLLVRYGCTVNLNMNGYSINRGLTAKRGNGFVICVYGTLNITGTSASQIKGGFTSGSGGGLHIADYGSVTLNGATITGNRAQDHGGGVNVHSTLSSFTMIAGTISNNVAETYYGGGVRTYGDFEMRNGTISGNTAACGGGGVFCDGSRTANFLGGTISGNRVTGGVNNMGGGGIAVWNSNTTIDGTNITGNVSATYGGGVCLGGMGLNNGNGRLTLKRTLISGNSANTAGGGVAYRSGASLTIAGPAQIKDNKKGSAKNNLWLATDKKILVTAALKNSTTAANIGVSTEVAPTSSAPVQFIDSYNSTTAALVAPIVFSADASGVKVAAASSANPAAIRLITGTAPTAVTWKVFQGSTQVNTGSNTTSITYTGKDYVIKPYSGSTEIKSGLVKMSSGGSTTFTTFSDVGSYTYIVNSASYSNNTFTYTVNAKQVGLTWSFNSKVYTGKTQYPTATTTGVASGDTCTVTKYNTDKVGTKAGTYSVTATALSNKNYKLPAGAAAAKSYIIDKAQLTVTAKAKTITYGDAPSDAGYTVTGFVNGETASVITGTPTYTHNYKQYGNVGAYTITPVVSGLKATNYTFKAVGGKLTVNKCDVSKVTVSAIAAQTYTGKALTPALTVKLGTKTLALKTDYTAAYSNNTNKGTATVKLSGAGTNFTGSGTKSVTFTINAANMSNTTVAAIAAVTYKGSAHTPTPTVTLGSTYTLVKDTDYTITYASNTNAGTATVTFTAKSANFTGTKSANFTINKANMSATTVADMAAVTYNGSAYTPTPTVKLGTAYTLVKDTDYTISYKDNVNKGTATLTFTGKGTNFTGTKTAQFVINAANMSATTVAAIADQTYTGAAIVPALTVKLGTVSVPLTTGYTVAGVNSSNVNVGEATLRLTGKGNYTGSKDVTFNIVKRDLADVTIADIPAQTYTGVALKPEFAVKYSTTKTLAINTDFTVKYTNNIEAGTATATITAAGNNFKGTNSTTFTINKANMSTVTVAEIPDQIYTAEAIIPTLSVKLGSAKVLALTTDYTIAAKDNSNVNVGTATLTLTGAGNNFTGTQDVTFEIVKADLNVETLPTVGENFVGQTIADVGLTAGLVKSARTQVTVPGTWAWTTAQNAIFMSGSHEYGVKFTPTDTANFNTVTGNVESTPTQLTVSVQETVLNTLTNVYELKPAVDYAVDYKSAINWTASLADENLAVKYMHDGVQVAFDQTLSAPKGYSIHYYTALDDANKPVGENEMTTTSISNITENGKMFVGYTAEEVTYKIYHIRQKLNGVEYPTLAEIDAGDVSLAEIETKTAITDTSVNIYDAGYAKTYAGFTLDLARSKQEGTISGDGSTVMFFMYSRNKHTVSWSTDGGQLPEYTTTFNFGAPITNVGTPVKTGYNFVGWFKDKEGTEKVVFDQDLVMGDEDLTFYAKYEVKKFKVTFNSNPTDPSIGIPDTTTYPFDWNNKSNIVINDKTEWSGDILTYSVESTFPIRLNLANTKPTALGYTFDGWYNEAGKRVTQINRPTAATEDMKLTAHWKATTYTVKFDYNGGYASTSSIRLVNNTAYDLTKLPKPTRAGYAFVGWYIHAEDVAEGVLVDTTEGGLGVDSTLLTFSIRDFVESDSPEARKLTTVTVIAGWNKVGHTITYTEDAESRKIHQTQITLSRGEDEIFVDDTPVYVGDKIKVTLTCAPGYRVTAVSVNNRAIANGAIFTVGTYGDETKINLTAEFEAVSYKITYHLQGGTLSDTNAVRSYTIEDDVALPSNMDGDNKVENVTKHGYTFDGWSDNAEVMNQVLIQNGSGTGEKKIGNIDIYAMWTPEKATVHLNNYGDASGEYHPTIESSTGATIEIPNPTRKNYEFVGWATTENAGATYFSTTASTTVSYTVLPDKIKGTTDDANVLYAVWQIANVQYLRMSVVGNNSVYAKTESGLVTMTATPSYQYEHAPEIKLVYKWYKLVDGGDFNACFEEKLLWEDKAGTIPVTDDNGVQLTYKVFVENANTKVVGSTYEVTADQANISATYSIKEVKESGTYICVVEAQAKDQGVDATSNIVTSKTAGYGTAVINIEKAEYEAHMTDLPVVYDGEAKSIVLDGVVVDSDNTFTLDDGSKVKVTYTYTDSNGAVIDDLTTVKNVGTYTVTATLAFVEGCDNGNYTLVPEATAEISITPKEITEVQFHMYQGETEIFAEDNVTPSFVNVYNEKAYKVVVTFAKENEADDVTFNLRTYKTTDTSTVDEIADGVTTDVGVYGIEVLGITGASIGNYVLEVYPTMTYEITKATHVVDWTLKDKTETYDGTEKTISIDKKGAEVTLPASVTVTYSTVYVPFLDGYAPANNTAANGNGGIAAGTYTVTATYTDSNSNYNAIDDMVAELTVQRAAYNVVYDTEATGEVADETFDPIGCGTEATAHVAQYNPNKQHKPAIASLVGNTDITVSYVYYRLNSVSGEYIPVTADEQANGFKIAGDYKIVASFTLASDAYKNNYLDIVDTSMYYTVNAVDIDRIEVTYTPDKEYQYKSEFDVSEITVTVFYANKTSEVVTTNFELFDVEENGIEFTVFCKAADAYRIKVRYLGDDTLTDEFEVKVNKANYDMSAVVLKTEDSRFTVTTEGEDTVYTATYNATQRLPEAIMDVKDVLGEPAIGVSATYSFTTSDNKITGEYKPVGVNDLKSAGTYWVKLGFVVADDKKPNYNDVEKVLYFKLVIESKVIEDSAITWKYHNGTAWVALPTTNLQFKNGEYTFQAEFTGEGEDRTVTTATVAVTAPTDVTAVKNAGTYTLTATLSGNYTVNATKEITIDGAAVDAQWFVVVGGNEVEFNAAEKQLIYNGQNHVASIKAYYTDLAGVKKALTIADAATLMMVDAKAYTVSALAATDTNYDVHGISDVTVTVYPCELTDEYVAAHGEYVWQYEKETDVWEAIPNNNLLTYKGAEYKFRLALKGVDDGDVYLNAVAHGEDGSEIAVRNVKTYTLDEVVANYKLPDTVVETVYITKYVIQVTWSYGTTASGQAIEKFVYNGEKQSLTVDAKAVGDEKDVAVADLLDLSDYEKIDACQDVLAVANLKSQYTQNYTLKDNQFTWGIEKKVIEFTWSEETFTYNGNEQAYTATASNLCTRAGVLDIVTLTYEKSGDNLTNGASVNAGAYTVTVKAVSNPNYTVEGSTTKTNSYSIAQAESTVHPVYKEYEDNVTYEGHSLRDVKLMLTEGDTNGTLAIQDLDVTKEANVGDVVAVVWNFTPASDNYKPTSGSIEVTVKKIATSQLKVVNEPRKSYIMGLPFVTIGMKISVFYNDYYEEEGVKFGRAPVDVTEEVLNTGFAIREDATDQILPSKVLPNAGSYTVIMEYQAAGESKLETTMAIQATASEILKIEIESSPNKMSYVEGQEFNDEGLVLMISYADGTSAKVSTGWTIANKKLTSGQTTVSLDYYGSTVTVPVTVGAKEVVSLTIDDQNVKKTYIEGESFNSTNLKVTLNYNDETSALLDDMTKLSYNPYQFSAEDTKVTVIYSYKVGEEDKICQADIEGIQVRPKSLIGLELSGDYKTVYGVGESFDRDNLVVTAVYDTNEKVVVSDYTLTPEILTIDTVEVLVTYGEQSKTITVTVNAEANEITALAIRPWVEGEAPAKPQISIAATHGADTVVYTYSNSEDGEYTATVPNTKGVWYLKAYIAETEDHGEATKTIAFTVNAASISQTENDNVVVEVDGGNIGIIPDAELTVEKVEDTTEITVEEQEVLAAYDIELSKTTGETVTVRLLIDESLRNREGLKVFYIDDEGNATDMNAEREEDYMVFETNHFSRYVITCPAAAIIEEPAPTGLIAGVSVGGVVAAGLVAAVVVVFILKKKRG